MSVQINVKAKAFSNQGLYSMQVITNGKTYNATIGGEEFKQMVNDGVIKKVDNAQPGQFNYTGIC